jgi:Na+-translocating ferredoxin:NAD+ oxidoreductase RnfG subunit
MKRHNEMTSVLTCSISLLLTGMVHDTATAQLIQEEGTAQQQAFKGVFGDAVIFDTDMVQKVRTDIQGVRHYVDHNGDGKPEEVWFMDTDPCPVYMGLKTI